MSRILWCGGSHLGCAISVVEALHKGPLKSWAFDRYLTAGPINRNWSKDGGRYRVDGTVVSANKRNPDEVRDLADYDAIVFVGQWITPFKILSGDMPISTHLLDRMLEGVPIHGYSQIGRRPIQKWYNEPLELFPKLAPGKVFLVPDPDSCMEGYRQVAIATKHRFWAHIEQFCAERGIRLAEIPEQVRTPELTSKPEYKRDGDLIHMNPAYWDIVLRESLMPILMPKLQETALQRVQETQ